MENGQRGGGQVIPNQDSLIGDLLSLDLNSPIGPASGFTTGVGGMGAPMPTAGQDLLGADLDSLVSAVFPST